MVDYLHIGSTPHSEDCIGVGNPDYYPKALEECERFKQQIARHYPPPPNARLKVKGFPHDFGTYHEVVVLFDDSDEVATQYAYDVENDKLNVLQFWDKDS